MKHLITQALERIVGVGHVKWLWLSAAVVVADQLTKFAVVMHFGNYASIGEFLGRAMSGELPDGLYRSFTVLPVFDIVLMVNTGAAFSLLADAGGWQRWFFILLAVGVIGMILYWLRTLPAEGQVRVASALALILGGAFGNLIDRATYGWVIDFLSFHWGGWYFPSFNIADSAITVGAALLIFDAVLVSTRRDA